MPNNHSEHDSGMGTTPGMWQLLVEELAYHEIVLPESLYKAIDALCADKAVVHEKDHD